MALCLKYFYCFSVFLSVFLPGIVSDEIDAVYKFLSWKLDDVLTETKHLKIKVDNIDARVKNVEEKLQGLQTTTPNPIDLRIEEQRRELETELKDSLEMQELAVQKMLSKEKMLLRESMKNFTIVFAELKSEIQTQMSVFNASFKEEVKSIGTEFDNLKSEIRLEMMEYNKTLSEDISAIKETVEINLKDMYEIGNNNSMVLMKGIAELTSDWNSTTHNISQILQTMEKTMVSNIEEIENRMIADVKKKQRETQQSISKVQADVHSLSTNISTFSSVLSNRISSESSSLSFNISSLSSSLLSQMSSHANRIYLLEERSTTPPSTTPIATTTPVTTTAIATTTPTQIKQWVQTVAAFSSEYTSSSWCANQVIGPPNVYPSYGDFANAWTQKVLDSNQFIEVQFAEAVYITSVEIYETYNAGGVKAIKAKSGGTWTTLWSVNTVQAIATSRIFAPPLSVMASPSKDLRLEIDCTASRSWVEIDAIQLIGNSVL